MLFKADDATDPNNYRPISFVSNFNSIYGEKNVFKRIESSMKCTNLLFSISIWLLQGMQSFIL